MAKTQYRLGGDIENTQTLAILRISKEYHKIFQNLYIRFDGLDQCHSPFSCTIRTWFKVPKQLGTVGTFFDPTHHLPSTKNLNSYLPGGKIKLAFHDPSLSSFMELALTSQLLKSPTKKTSFALGAFNENVTLRLYILNFDSSFDMKDGFQGM